MSRKQQFHLKYSGKKLPYYEKLTAIISLFFVIFFLLRRKKYLLNKSMDSFLCDKYLPHERVNNEMY